MAKSLERTLRDRWCRKRKREGFKTRAMSPHQIRGLPDLFVVDGACSDVVKGYKRTRGHWVEAKVVGKGPKAFRAERDATAHQVKWVLEYAALGLPTWWLIMDDQGYAIIPGTQLSLSRDAFRQRRRAYDSPAKELREPEDNRKALIEATRGKLEAIELEVVRLFGGKDG